MSAYSVITSPSLEVSAGLELLESDDSLVEDISDDFLTGEVAHDNDALISGSANMTLTRAISWGGQRLRPYLTLTDLRNGETVRWNMGVYLPTTPAASTEREPVLYSVEAFDKTSVLDTAYGETFVAASGAGYLDTIDSLLSDFGESADALSQDAAALTLPADRVWPLDSKNTYLQIINDLLAEIGYVRLYADRDGTFRAEPRTSIETSGVVFNYSTASENTILSPAVQTTSDIYAVPNKWVFVNGDPAGSLPAVGAGIYVVTNQSDGETSIDARGRTITKVETVDAADQATLVTIGDGIVQQDRQVVEELSIQTGPNPSHWHNSVVTVDAPEAGAAAGSRFAEVAWTHPLGRGIVQRKLRRVVPI